MIRFRCPSCRATLATAEPNELGACSSCGLTCRSPDAPLGLPYRPPTLCLSCGRPLKGELPCLACEQEPRGGSFLGCLLVLLLFIGLGVAAFAAGWPTEFEEAVRWVRERFGQSP